MKRAFVLALCLVGLLVVAIAAIPFLVSTDLAKRRIAEEIARLTGRAVTFAGEPKVSFFPHINVELRDISLANPETMKGAPFIALDAVIGRIRILPLFVGRTEVAEFQLVNPRVSLRVDAEGRANWKVRPDGPTPSADQSEGKDRSEAKVSEGAPAPVKDPWVRLGRFVIRGGSITYDNERSGQHEAINGIDVNFAWPSVDAPAAGSGHFTWRRQTVEFNAAIGAPLALIAGEVSPLRFAIASTPIRVSFNGTGINIGEMQLNGDATVTTPSVRRLMAWLGKPIGQGSTFGAAAISGNLTWVKPAATFDDAKIELDGNRAEGAVTASFGARPKVEGTLAFDKLDLSAYLEAFRASLDAQGPWRSAPAAMHLAASDLDLRLSAAEVIAGSARIGRTAAAVNVDNGKLILTIGEAQFYGGAAQAHLSATMDGDVLKASGEAELDKVATRAALAGLTGLDALDGKGDANIDLTAEGKTWGEVAESAAGTATVAIADGQLSGVDVARLAEIASNPAALSGHSGATAFSQLDGTLTLADGAVTSADLRAVGTGYAATVGGRISLGDSSVQGLGTLTAAKTDSPSQPTEVPFLLGGTFDDILILPDFGRMTKRNAAELKDTGVPIDTPPVETAPHG
jgi:AsmA protein